MAILLVTNGLFIHFWPENMFAEIIFGVKFLSLLNACPNTTNSDRRTLGAKKKTQPEIGVSGYETITL